MPSRRAELIAGALTGDLSDQERLEFDQARAADPSIDVELAELRAAAGRLDAAHLTWSEEELPASLGERIRAATSEAAPDSEAEDRRSAS